MKNKFFVLLLAGVLSTFVALPYVFALEYDVITQTGKPLLFIALVAAAQSIVVLAIAIFFGLRLARSIGLPVLALFESNTGEQVASPKNRTELLARIFKLAVPLGFGIAVVLKLLDLYFIAKIPGLADAMAHIPFWKNILAAPYGGVVEELLMRLFLMTLFAWLLGKITRTKDVVGTSWIMWTAIVGAAVVFGLGHLPATATITAITTLVVVRAILLNGIGGIVFGWLFWKKGLECGIATHFVTDIFLIAILPLLFH